MRNSTHTHTHTSTDRHRHRHRHTHILHARTLLFQGARPRRRTRKASKVRHITAPKNDSQNHQQIYNVLFFICLIGVGWCNFTFLTSCSGPHYSKMRIDSTRKHDSRQDVLSMRAFDKRTHRQHKNSCAIYACV